MSEDKVIMPTERLRIGTKICTSVADKPADVVMTGLEASKLDRALDLLSLAYREMRSPHKSGPVWAQYRAQSARRVGDALWEAHLLLSGRPPRTIDS